MYIGARRTLLRRKTSSIIANTLALDGVGAEGNGSGATVAVTLSTSLTNDIIIVCVLSNGGAVTGVSGSTLGAFTLRASNGGASPIETWWKPASSALSSEVITVSAPASFTTVIAFAVNGAKIATPFDGSAVTSSAGPSDPLAITTTNANTFIFGTFRASTPTMTAGSGFTVIKSNSDFMLAEYKIVSATQSGLSVPIGTGVGTSNGGIADALVQGP